MRFPAMLPVLALLAGCSLFTDEGGLKGALPSGSCRLASFLYRDRMMDSQIGPDLQGEFSITAATATDSLAGWSGRTDGVLGRRHTFDGQPIIEGVQFLPVVPSGSYRGTWKAQGDSVRWSFDDDTRGISWVRFQPWQLRGRTLVAKFGNLDSLGWTLDAEITC